MSFPDREQRLQFLGLTAHDAELLCALRPLIERHGATIEDEFYAQLLAFPETAQLLRDRTTVDRLKRLQREYLLRITEGKFDEAYFADRRRIGQAHERVGLSSCWYLLAYSHYFRIMAPLIRHHFAADAGRADAAVLALQKAFMLDASLAMDAYIASDRFRHLQQLESIINDSADVIFSLDADKHFRTWNHAAERIFGWSAAEIIGKHLSLIVPAELLKAGELPRIDHELETAGHHHWETVRVAKDGRRIPVEVTVSALGDQQGTIIGRSVILRDISERKRLEESKLQAERLAVIGAMSAKLAHEIRNPLNSITLNIDLAADEIDALAKNQGADATEARALLRSIGSEVRRIQRVTEDYLQFARMPKPHRDWVEVNDVLAQGLSFMQSLFTATGVTIRTEYTRGLPLIHADEEQLWQAILNIIRNALEAMPGGGTLSLRTACEGDEVLIRIADTGKGMTAEEHAQIFKPFFSTKTGGTGLGLPLTQQIITEHGGRVDCESVARQGTTFTLRLPGRPIKATTAT
jgi:PAS domain S-box-containing protein